MDKTEEFYERMVSGETVKDKEFQEDFNKLEKMTMGNPEIMEHATKEEIQSYLIIDEISDEDFGQMLYNIADILQKTKGKTKEDAETIYKMEREFLKLLLIERWTNRANKT